MVKKRMRSIPLFLIAFVHIGFLGTPSLTQDVGSDLISELLALPAPPPPPGLPSAESPTKSEETQSVLGPPGKDAPLEILSRYWARIPGRDAGNISELLRTRLLTASEAYPELLPKLLDKLPKSEDAHKKIKAIFDSELEARRLGTNWFEKVARHLMLNSVYFRKELIQEARSSHDNPDGGYVKKSDELEALARLDWEKAEPMLLEFADGDQPRRAALALSLLYRHYFEAGNLPRSDLYRDRLGSIVEDREALGRARATAAEVLFSTDWEERDAWYISLFKDPTLKNFSDGYRTFSPLRYPVWKDPDKWIPILTSLVDNPNRAIHDSAVSVLADFHLGNARRDALLPLLPWLENPDWASNFSMLRLRVIQSMDRLDIPESIPGLIAVLDQDNSTERAYAADSLASYRTPRAIPALKRALERETYPYHRRFIIKGLLECGGVSTSEAITSIESFALAAASTPPGNPLPEVIYNLSESKDTTSSVALGIYLSRRDLPLNEDVVEGLLERAEELKSQQPRAAKILTQVLDRWPSSAADRDFLRRLQEGKIDAEAIHSALHRRESFQKNVAEELRLLGKKGGGGAGFAAVLLRDPKLQVSILSGSDQEALITMLASARLIREPLNVEQVGRLLQSERELVARVAERYLRAEDGPEARKLVLTRHAGEALILGGRQFGDPGHNTYSAFDSLEQQVRELVLEEGGPDEVYALLSAGYWGSAGQILIRVRGNSGEITYHEDSARYYHRTFSQEELALLRDFIFSNHVEDQGPLSTPTTDGMQYEFIHVSPSGGRRVFMNNPGLARTGGTVYDRLTYFFRELVGKGKMDVTYPAEDEIPGLKVLLAEHNLPVVNVWKEGDDFRILVLDERPSGGGGVTTKTPEGASVIIANPPTPEPRWASFSDGKISDGTTTPPPFAYPTIEGIIPPDFEWKNELHPAPWALQVDGTLFRVGSWNKQKGLWKFTKGENPELIVSCTCAYPVITPDGRWAVLPTADQNWAQPNELIRVNLTSKEIHEVTIPAADTLYPVAYISTVDRILVYRAQDTEDSQEEPNDPEFFLLNPDTGHSEPVTGEFSPLTDLHSRPLQITGMPNQVWAAIYDRDMDTTRIGRYYLSNFKFEGVLELPSFQLNSATVWVETSDGSVYFAYRGHLLRVPFPLETRIAAPSPPSTKVK